MRSDAVAIAVAVAVAGACTPVPQSNRSPTLTTKQPPAAGTAPAIMNKQPRLGPAATFRFPRAQRFRLKNGLSVILIPKRDLPLVRIRLAFPGGSSADPVQARGLAHVTASMLERGAGARAALDFSGALQDLGATLVSWADQDHAQLELATLRRNLEPGLDLMLDALLRPRLTRGELERLKRQLRGQVTQRRARPAQIAHLALKAALFGDHPYGRPMIPLPAWLKEITPERVKKFHRARYRPEGGVLIAAGDISADEIKALLEPRLKGWSGAPPSPPAVADAPAQGPRLVLVDRPGATQSVIRVGHLGPARGTKMYAAMETLNTVLGGSFTSRLNQNLREDHGYTYGVRSMFLLRRRGGLFVTSTSVETEDTVAALAEILKELRGAVSRPLTRSELTKGKRLQVEEQPARAETVGGLMEAHADLALNGLPLTRLDSYPEQVDALTAEKITAAARLLIKADRATIAVAGDLKKIRAPLEAEYGKAQLRDVDGALKM